MTVSQETLCHSKPFGGSDDVMAFGEVRPRMHASGSDAGEGVGSSPDDNLLVFSGSYCLLPLRKGLGRFFITAWQGSAKDYGSVLTWSTTSPNWAHECPSLPGGLHGKCFLKLRCRLLICSGKPHLDGAADIAPTAPLHHVACYSPR